MDEPVCIPKKRRMDGDATSRQNVEVSIILPIYNAEKWLDECLLSVKQQTFSGKLELSVYNDGSTDRSQDILKSWIPKLEDADIVVTFSDGKRGSPDGVGYAKNRAIEQSQGRYLCFLDSDDVMDEERVQLQYDAGLSHPNALIGCQFSRVPEGSTNRYTRWANELKQEQLYTQAYTSHGPTVIMPTWYCSRDTFDRVGKFDESGKGTPEDLIFFYEHLQKGGKLHRVNHCLLSYRYHPEATTFSVKEKTIWDIRMQQIQEQVISQWKSFTIWNAGKQGRQFYRSLSESNRKKVDAFCDVDQKKIGKGHYTYEESKERPKPTIPIVHFAMAKPPLVICVKQDLSGGSFESNLLSLSLTEGVDYFHFN